MMNRYAPRMRLISLGFGALGFVGTSLALGVGCDDDNDIVPTGGNLPIDGGRDAGSGGGGTGASATSCPSPVPVFNAVDPIDGHMCHPSRCTPGFCQRGDIAPLATEPQTVPLQDRLATIDCSPHTYPPMPIFAEATQPQGDSQLFQYYLLDSTGFEPSVFTTIIPGLNETAMRTVWGANCDLPTIGSVRLALEPKPGLPTDPKDPRAFIDIFTDIRGLFVINNESGWYEGWMIWDLRIAPVADANANGQAKFGTITPADAEKLAAMGPNNAVAGNFFTVDGQAPRFPSPTDKFPTKVTNVVPLNLSMGAYNALQQSDVHSYWEFNYTTNWVHPLYELPFTGGFPAQSATAPATAFEQGLISAMQSIVPGNAPGSNNRSRALAVQFGDNPTLPRDPDKFDAEIDAQREFRERFVPSGIAKEALLNAFERLASFEPNVTDLTQRLLDGYKAAVATVDTNGNGIVSALEGDIDTANPNCPQGDNTCIFIPAPAWNRFAVTREINDGLLAPRFAPSTRGWVLSGNIVTGFPVLGTSVAEDSDDR